MKIIDPHIHAIARTTDDLEAMATAGIVAVVEPAFWLGSDRRRFLIISGTWRILRRSGWRVLG